MSQLPDRPSRARAMPEEVAGMRAAATGPLARLLAECACFIAQGAGQLDLSPKRRPNLWAGMPSSVIAHVGSGCRIVGPEVLAAVAPERFVLNASWFIRFN